MGATKTEHFTETQNEIATLAKALGHPARIAIIEYLTFIDKLVTQPVASFTKTRTGPCDASIPVYNGFVSKVPLKRENSYGAIPPIAPVI